VNLTNHFTFCKQQQLHNHNAGYPKDILKGCLVRWNIKMATTPACSKRRL